MVKTKNPKTPKARMAPRPDGAKAKGPKKSARLAKTRALTGAEPMNTDEPLVATDENAAPGPAAPLAAQNVETGRRLGLDPGDEQAGRAFAAG